MTLEQVIEIGERPIGMGWLVLPTWSRISIRLSHLLPRVLIVVTVKTQQLPVAAVGWIVVVVMVFMMDCEFAKLLAAKFAPTPCTDPGIQLERLRSIGLLALIPVVPRLGNNLILPVGL